MKRIFLLADAGSEHTEKWALGLADIGFEIGIFSIEAPTYRWFEKNKSIQFLSSEITKRQKNTRFSKLSYLKLVPKIKEAIKLFCPDIVHAHYATSYGMLARLSGFKPYFISAWGTDVMKFPDRSFINKIVLKRNLQNAEKVFATSQTIVEFIHKVIDIPVTIIPFGVDLNQFKPAPKLALFEEGTFVIAAIKVLESIYCIDVLIKAFARLKMQHPDKKLGLLLVGEGSLRQELEALCIQLEIQDYVIFTGRVNFSEVANYFNTADIFVNISEYESFGVSVIEASACEKPVIVTDVGGLREVVDEGITGFRIKVHDVSGTAEALENLLLNPELRGNMGKNGRKKVQALYDWKINLNQMAEYYNQIN